ncbi:hypothetical protein [Aeromonas salmonicida]|uniref:hypothetical protein n=1 Tax=Aeromonas salmonicida TaxID=645 RepID=UPI00267A288C
MEQDSFCGTTFNDGKLTVVGWEGRQGSNKMYKVHCSECANDPELHGDAIYPTTKHRLMIGGIPCGCSKRTNWTSVQYQTLLSRLGNGQFMIQSSGNVTSQSRVDCTCMVEGCSCKWTTVVYALILYRTGCPKCDDHRRSLSKLSPESNALEMIRSKCKINGWTFDGFREGRWNGTKKTHLKLKCCHCDCEWSPVYYSVVSPAHDVGCPSCAKSGYDPSKPGTFYTYLWTSPDTNHSFLKYGISNIPKTRIRNQRRANSKYTAKQLCSISFEDGTIAANLEKVIDDHKRNNSIPDQVSHNDFPDGFTETLPTEEWPFIANLIQEQTMCKLSPL